MNGSVQTPGSPFAIANIRFFILFRCFFNARFYYPVFTILFLDYGLTLEQFSLLNTVWAITIVCTEVPSGALADILGRKYLIVITALLMTLEMALLAFIPLGDARLIFWAFLCNRIFSGLAEAMVSGADEAIAYDSLVDAGLKDHWPRVLSTQYRLQAVASVITLTVGALVYSAQSVNGGLHALGIDLSLSQQTTMRFPIYLTLGFALLALFTSLQMRETGRQRNRQFSVMATTKKIFAAICWIIKTPFALFIILFGMCCDHVLRLIATFSSQYFRCIELPDASFGIIGAAMSLLGIIIPKIAEKMIQHNSPKTNVLWMAGLVLFSLFGLAGFFPLWGIFFVGCTFSTMTFISFFSSSYLNAITDSHQRATVLSFKGLAFNLAYGFIGFVFALLLNFLKGSLHGEHPVWSELQLETHSFIGAIGWLPWYMAFFLVILMIFARWFVKDLPAVSIEKMGRNDE